MTSPETINAFLEGTDWNAALRHDLPADASSRRYTRLHDTQRGATALLMIAPPDLEPKTGQFVNIAKWLVAQGLSAPEIYKASLDEGLVLLEDFGQDSFAAILEPDPGKELALYSAAGNVVCALDAQRVPDLPPYDAPFLKQEVDLFANYWWPDHFGTEMPDNVRAEFDAAWAKPLAFLDQIARTRPAVTLRDFHKDNLFHLPARDGLKSVGLIDFQDAQAGHAAYDLVSLLQDARRDIPAIVQSQVFAQVNTALNDPDFEEAYGLYGAQRAMKILGIFVRLDTVYGKPHYRQHLERTWSRLRMNLGHDKLSPLKQWLETHIPSEGTPGR